MKQIKIYMCALVLLLVINNIAKAQNTTYQALYTDATFTKTISTGLPVGVIDGKQGTTETGGATYSIPIKLPPGTNGLVPELSIVYNSQSGNGIAGFGWNISGLSTISLTNKSLYFDNSVAPVTLDITKNPTGNPYSLDGARLIPNGTNIYSLETENFSVVKATPPSSNALYGPLYFTSYAKNGMQVEYGNTSTSANSIFKSDDGLYPIIWSVSKIRDRNNNYIEYKYRTDKRNFLIDEINYTGKEATGTLPYNKIKFYYTERFDSTRVYISGSSLGNNYLLEKIVITDDGNNIVKTYKFFYSKNDIHSVLQEVVELGSDNSQLNSTIFKNGNQVYSTITSSVCGSNSNINTTDIYSGDYNGDGKSDMLIAQKDITDISGIKHNINFYITSPSTSPPNGYLSGITPLTINSSRVENEYIPNMAGIAPSDFDGDGKSDILITNTSVISSGAGKVDNIKLYFSRLNNPGNPIQVYFDIVTKTPVTNSGHTFDRYSSAFTNFLQIGDFDGDGASDYMLVLNSTSPPSGYNPTQILISYPNRNIYNRLVTQSFYFNPGTNINDASYLITSNDVKIIDFDGDGKSDILFTKGNYCRIFTFNEDATNTNTGIKVLYSSGSGLTVGYPTKYHKILVGDFNGDKKSDLFTVNTLNLAEVAYSNGKTFTKSTFTFNTSLTNSNNKNIVLGDFNGDGKTDICHSIALSTSSRKAQVYYTISNKTFWREDYTYTVSATGNLTNQDLLLDPNVIVDSDGDGNFEPIASMSYNQPIQCYKFPQANHKYRLTKIIDGYNRKIEFNYQPLTIGAPFYVKDVINWQEPVGNAINKINTIINPLYMVASVTVPDALGNNNTTSFSYQGAYYNSTGKGFLGIGTITMVNPLNNLKTETKNILNTQFCTIYPKTISNYLLDNTLLSLKTITNTIVDAGNKKFYRRVDALSDINYFTGATSSESYTYDDYGNILTSSKNINNEEITTSTNSGYFSIALWGSATYLPTQSVITKTRTGSPSYTVATTYVYDAYWNLKTENISDGTTQKLTKNYFRNSYGNIYSESITDVANSKTITTSYEYDAKQRFVTKKTNTIGQFELYTYDSKWGKPLSVTGIDNLTVVYEYDGFGKQKKTTLPDGSIITNTFTWDILNGSGTSTGNVDNSLYYSLIQHSCRPDVKTTYDKFERVRSSDKQGFNNQWISEVTSYDAKGNIKTTTAPFYTGDAPIITTNTYDVFDRLIMSSNSIGSTNVSYSNSNGKQTVTTTTPSGQVKSKIIDASRKVVSAIDGSGTLTYTYDSHGNQTKVMYNGNEILVHIYDWFGKQTSTTDKNSGTYLYTYNAFGWLKYQKDNKGQEWNMSYDDLGRITLKSGPEGTISYQYFTTGNGINQLKKTTGYNGINDEYTYDSYGRKQTYTNTINGVGYNYSYTYDACNNLKTYTYPSGFTLNKNYDANGNILTIKNTDNTKTIFTANGKNAYNNFTNYTLGNGKSTIISYDIYGKPTNYSASGVQNLTYTYNNTNGNITSRTDAVKNKSESFQYDGLDRLTSMQVSGLSVKQIDYSDNGNITQKTDAGHYSYDNDKINAVNKISAIITSSTQSEPCDISEGAQYIEYTPFNQPSAIYEDVNELHYTYGPDNQRSVALFKTNNVSTGDRLYLDNYEINRSITGNNPPVVQNQIHYIAADDQLVCMMVKEGGTEKYYYIYNDNLGSILSITNESGTVVAEQNFDAWGRYRNPNTWEYISGATALANNPVWLYRGYTGHEMLAQFDLINMNGRVYDPIIGRMLSPDNYVEDPYTVQGYNRYSYVINNPLKYDDPSGQIAPLVVFGIAALIGGGINVATHWSAITAGGKFNVGAFFSAFGIGAGAGILGAVSGGAASAAVITAMGGAAAAGAGGAILSGIVGGVVGSVPSTAFLSVGNNITLGDQLLGPSAYIQGAAMGGILGGTIGIVSFKIQQFRLTKANATPSVQESVAPPEPARMGPPRGSEIDPIESIGGKPLPTTDLDPIWQNPNSLERGFNVEGKVLKEFYDNMDLIHTPKASLWDGQSDLFKVSIKSTYSQSMKTNVSFDYMTKMAADGAIDKVLHIVTPKGTVPSNLGTIMNWAKELDIRVVLTHL